MNELCIGHSLKKLWTRKSQTKVGKGGHNFYRFLIEVEMLITIGLPLQKHITLDLVVLVVSKFNWAHSYGMLSFLYKTVCDSARMTKWSAYRRWMSSTKLSMLIPLATLSMKNSSMSDKNRTYESPWRTLTVSWIGSVYKKHSYRCFLQC